MIVILDNGHGIETQGKQSPCGTLKEYEFNRDIVARIHVALTALGIESLILVPELKDIPLNVRVQRANAIYRKNPDAFLVSVHANAGGGTGWEAFTSRGETKSDEIANEFYKSANEFFGGDWKIRKDYSDGDIDKEANFYILKHTNCPAILTENFFMDTNKDLEYIKSEYGRSMIAAMHIDAIKNFRYD